MDKGLYNKEDTKLMRITKESISKSRVDELIMFAKKSGYQKIGIANCITMQKYAENLKEILEKSRLEVFNIHCKESGLQNSDIIGENVRGPSCDPASQAKYLNESNTELNINMGLCLGHGIIFNKHSKAPVTTLIVKDFANNHKTVEELGD